MWNDTYFCQSLDISPSGNNVVLEVVWMDQYRAVLDTSARTVSFDYSRQHPLHNPLLIATKYPRGLYALWIWTLWKKFPVVNEYLNTTPLYQKSIPKFNIWILSNQDFRSEGTCYPKMRYQVLQGTMDQPFGRRSYVENRRLFASSLPRISPFPPKRRFTLILCESHHLLK